MAGLQYGKLKAQSARCNPAMFRQFYAFTGAAAALEILRVFTIFAM